VSGIASSASVEVVTALFTDLSSEGSSEQTKSVFAQRERDAETLKVWIDAFESVNNKPESEGKADLQALLASEERRADPSDASATSVRELIKSLMSSSGGSRGFTERVKAQKEIYERQRQLALRHKAR
jgi:hypothetical protein